MDEVSEELNGSVQALHVAIEASDLPDPDDVEPEDHDPDRLEELRVAADMRTAYRYAMDARAGYDKEVVDG